MGAGDHALRTDSGRCETMRGFEILCGTKPNVAKRTDNLGADEQVSYERCTKTKLYAPRAYSRNTLVCQTNPIFGKSGQATVGAGWQAERRHELPSARDRCRQI